MSVNRRQQFVAQMTSLPDIPDQTKDEDTVFANDDDITPVGEESTLPDSILQAIATEPPMSVFVNRVHSVRPMRVRAKDRSKPQPTNKFYGNLMLGDSHAPIWTHPYGLRWDSTGSMQQGLGISHIDDSSKAFGPPGASGNGSSRYYINPFLVSMGLSATELNVGHEMTVGDFGEFGCTMVLMPAYEHDQGRLEDPASFIRIPIVRGMAFITGVYRRLTPRIFSNVLIRTLTLVEEPRMSPGWVKYRFLIENGVTWVLYAKAERDQDPPLRLELRGQGQAVAISGKFSGIIQIAKAPVGNEDTAESLYDASVGVYTTAGELVIRDSYLDGHAGGYRIDWLLAGDKLKQLLHFTMPHHRDVLTDAVTPTSLVLPSTTKGKMVAYLGSEWHLYEPSRLSVGFLPDGWSGSVSQQQLQVIRAQAEKDVELNFETATDLDSMYFAGKGLAKFGLLCLVVKDALKDAGPMYQKCLKKLKSAFARFMENRQQFPLVYDTTWKGLISSQGLDRGALADFGNTWYNWEVETISPYVNSLLRDVANPSRDDPYFPVFRSFDWFMGHSWSQGIFESLDGKDEESTSEDINLYYAMSLWARVDNKPKLDKMSQLILTIARRSIQSYFLMEDGNTNHPKCIQGIQMIPATPALPLIRRKEFIRQEWETLLKSRVGEINDGWRSILMMNYAALDKDEAWKYFLDESRGPIPLDDGMTKTWALFYVASQQSPSSSASTCQ
ncbi:hypothetical protein BGZ51_005778 [Haplosporangium sp. Z 767]|nr:hypothetical protein BGZ51_005778 [Haplosporangium sp. Z 767]